MTSLSSPVTWPSAQATLTRALTIARSWSCIQRTFAYRTRASTSCSFLRRPGSDGGRAWRPGGVRHAFELARDIPETPRFRDPEASQEVRDVAAAGLVTSGWKRFRGGDSAGQFVRQRR